MISGRKLERLISTGDVTAWDSLFRHHQRIGTENFSVPSFIMKFFLAQAKDWSWHTAWHDSNSLRTRIFYGGDLAFSYGDGIILVTGCYQPGHKYFRFLDELDSSFKLFDMVRNTGTEEITNDLRSSITRSDGLTRGVIIKVADGDTFQKLATILDRWLLRFSGAGLDQTE